MNNATLLMWILVSALKPEKCNSKHNWTTFILGTLKVRIADGENIHLTVNRHKIIDNFTCIIFK